MCFDLERSSNGQRLKAREVVDYLVEKLDGQLAQLGGDATTGRGQVLLRIARPAAAGSAEGGVR
jgi:CRISPR/Cas system CMR subunit Cmr4 (Cas7 group RAMP superfamily)